MVHFLYRPRSHTIENVSQWYTCCIPPATAVSKWYTFCTHKYDFGIQSTQMGHFSDLSRAIAREGGRRQFLGWRRGAPRDTIFVSSGPVFSRPGQRHRLHCSGGIAYLCWGGDPFFSRGVQYIGGLVDFSHRVCVRRAGWFVRGPVARNRRRFAIPGAGGSWQRPKQPGVVRSRWSLGCAGGGVRRRSRQICRRPACFAVCVGGC